jgi:hypothetical protein
LVKNKKFKFLSPVIRNHKLTVIWQSKGIVFLVQAIKVYGDAEAEIHTFLTLALDKITREDISDRKTRKKT